MLASVLIEGRECKMPHLMPHPQVRMFRRMPIPCPIPCPIRECFCSIGCPMPCPIRDKETQEKTKTLTETLTTNEIPTPSLWVPEPSCALDEQPEEVNATWQWRSSSSMRSTYSLLPRAITPSTCTQGPPHRFRDPFSAKTTAYKAQGRVGSSRVSLRYLALDAGSA